MVAHIIYCIQSNLATVANSYNGDELSKPWGSFSEHFRRTLWPPLGDLSLCAQQTHFHRNKATLILYTKQPPRFFSVIQLSSNSLLLVLWKTRPILISPSHFQRNQRTHWPSSMICVYCVCPVCAHALRRSFFCVYWAPVCVCVGVPLCVCMCVHREGGVILGDWYCTSPCLFVGLLLVLVARRQDFFWKRMTTPVTRPCSHR